MPMYSDAIYWEERYANESGAYDWYQGYYGLAELLAKHVPKTSKILQVGVGTSRLQEQMVRHGGYQDILNLDFSTVVIKQMRELHKAMPQLKYEVSDCRSMPEIPKGYFDVVLDKGTLDAMLCGEAAAESSLKMLQESHRVLKPGGMMITVTYGDPLSRLPYFLGSSYPVWDSCQVYCVAKLEQIISATVDSSSTPVDEESHIPLLKGPYEYRDVDAMESLSNLEAVNYVYIMKKGLDH